MKVLHLTTKDKYLNILETFHIYNISKKRLQTNETYTDLTDPIYDILIKTLNAYLYLTLYGPFTGAAVRLQLSF
jgi:hypothetical protein